MASMRWRILGLGALALIFGACASSVNVNNGNAGPGSYASASIVLESRCSSCHGADKAEAGLRLDSWEAIFRGSQYGEAIIPFDSDNSIAVELATKLDSDDALASAHQLDAGDLAALRAWIDAGAKSSNGDVPFAESENLIYACNQGEAVVSVIDAVSNQVVRTIDLKKLGYSPTAKPHHVAASADGKYWYLSLIGDNKILKFDRDNNVVATGEFERPGMVVQHPSNGELRVGRSMSAVDPPQRIGIVDSEDMSVDEIDVFFPRPHALAIRPQGDYTYTASLAENRIMIVSPDDEVSFIELEGPTHTLVQFAISPDGQQMVVGTQLTGKVMFFELADPAMPKLVKTVDANAAPWHPTYSADGRLVYVGNFGANTITILDARTMEIVEVLTGEGIASPHGSAVSADGKYIYISNRNLKSDYKPRHNFGDNDKIGTVVVIDSQSRDIVKVLELENMTTGLGASQ